MKDLVKKVTAFILFDSPIDLKLIDSEFLLTHSQYKEQLPHWPFAASRKKLIMAFWFKEVFPHFLALLVLSIGALVPFQKTWSNSTAPLFFSALITFCILGVLYYWPIFYGDYLPKLATVIAEQEKLAIDEDDLKKCKRSQYSIPTLTIIFYVWSKMAEIPMVPVNDHSAMLLNNLYGSDKDKLKQNLARLYKFSFLSSREKAEMQKGISTARLFFQELNHPSAGTLLDEMENKLQKA